MRGESAKHRWLKFPNKLCLWGRLGQLSCCLPDTWPTSPSMRWQKLQHPGNLSQLVQCKSQGKRWQLRLIILSLCTLYALGNIRKIVLFYCFYVFVVSFVSCWFSSVNWNENTNYIWIQWVSIIALAWIFGIVI